MKLLLVIDVADDAAENYKDFTVDYDLRGTPIDDEKVNESIEYVEDCPLRPLPQKTSGHGKTYCMVNSRVSSIPAYGEYDRGWNDCIDAITGEKDESGNSD